MKGEINKKITISLVIFIILVIISFWVYPKIKELYIKTEINRANYCKIDSDCVDAGGKCPFNCYSYVNKNEVERISGLIDSFDSRCAYQCISCPTAICENNKCKEVCN